MSLVTGCQAFFEDKCMFLPFFRPKQYKLWTKSGKMLNYVTFLMPGINFSFPPFPVKFSILVKSKMAATFDEVTGPQQHRIP